MKIWPTSSLPETASLMPASRSSIPALAIILCIVGTVVDMKGVDLVIDVFLIGFSFGSFLIGRLESLNLMQVNLSDINIYFYIDIVLYIAALALSIITAVVKKENK